MKLLSARGFIGKNIVRRTINYRQTSESFIASSHSGKESAEGLRQLADDTEQHLESLKTLKGDITEQIIVPLLEEKLNRKSVEKLVETLERGVFLKLEKMLEFLYKTASRLSKRERDLHEPVSSHENKTSNQERGEKQNKYSAKQTFLSNDWRT